MKSNTKKGLGIFLGGAAIVTTLALVLSKVVKGSTDATVSGLVTNATDGKPIANATVRLTDFSVPPSGHYSIDKSTKSDSQGNYSFAIDLSSIYTPPGWVGDGRGVTIEAIAFGYGYNEVSKIINTGENQVDILLSK